MTAKVILPDADVKRAWFLVLNISSVILVLIAILLIFAGISPGWMLLASALYLLFIYLPIALYYPAYYKSLSYHILPDFVMVKKGVFWKRRSHIPYSKITNIDITEGPIERMYGLCTIHLQTAGFSASETANAEGVMQGIKNAEAIKTQIQNQINALNRNQPVITQEKDVLQEILEELRKLNARD